MKLKRIAFITWIMITASSASIYPAHAGAGQCSKLIKAGPAYVQGRTHIQEVYVRKELRDHQSDINVERFADCLKSIIRPGGIIKITNPRHHDIPSCSSQLDEEGIDEMIHWFDMTYSPAETE